MPELKIHNVPIQDDYSETFTAQMCRIVVTGINRKWAYEAAMETKGIGRSATMPPCEATIEREVLAGETPDGRPGFVIQLMDRKLDNLQQCLALRLRKGAVPVPTSSVFDFLPSELVEQQADLTGSVVQRFGDGFEREEETFGQRVFAIPRMDGWMYVARHFGVCTAVTGGMFLILGATREAALAAAEAALAATATVPLIVVKCAASGSKVGAVNYVEMVATTNHTYCPTLRESGESKLPAGVECVYEMIVSGARESDVRSGMRIGIEAATQVPGVVAIHTANYGGKLGKGKIQLHSLFDRSV